MRRCKASCNSQALALAARQLGGVVPDHSVHAVRQRRHMLGQIGGLQTLLYPLGIDGLPQRDVCGNAVIEHDHILADQCELGPQGSQVPVL